MESRPRDRLDLHRPVQLLGVIGDDRLEALRPGLRVQLDVLRAGPTVQLVDVHHVVRCQKNAHDLDHGPGDVLIEQQLQATTC